MAGRTRPCPRCGGRGWIRPKPRGDSHANTPDWSKRERTTPQDRSHLLRAIARCLLRLVKLAVETVPPSLYFRSPGKPVLQMAFPACRVGALAIVIDPRCVNDGLDPTPQPTSGFRPRRLALVSKPQRLEYGRTSLRRTPHPPQLLTSCRSSFPRTRARWC